VDERMGCRQISDELNRRGYRRRSGLPWTVKNLVLTGVFGVVLRAGFYSHMHWCFNLLLWHGCRNDKGNQRLQVAAS
jgi:hypothetical protein